jgi:F-type H+-transporting ATPase subunit epsilon
MATFHFDLVSPAKLVFAGDVTQVDVPGVEGDFGVLAGHAPLVATVKPGILKVYGGSGGAPQSFVVLGGFAEVSADGLTILADVATPEDEADLDLIKTRIGALEESTGKLKDATSFDERKQLDRLVERLDHFRTLDWALRGDDARPGGAAH